MIFRLLYLIALIGVIGSDARAETRDDDEPTRMGGEGFGNVMMLGVLLGVLVLGAIITIAVLALGGYWDNPNVDPPV
jgi:hypothetical protein